jgi:DNA-binding transcriptional ArsR family regulator
LSNRSYRGSCEKATTIPEISKCHEGDCEALQRKALVEGKFIEYRRLSMNVSRENAATWAAWFRALGDPTRVLILNLLATEARPMSVNEIVEAVDVGQSTVSHHLKILGDVRFILVDRQGTTSWWRINDACLDCFPTAAELVMGRLPTSAPWDQPQPAAQNITRTRR